MRRKRLINIISYHAAGPADEVIIGGGAPFSGDTIWAKSRFFATDQRLRRFVLNDPRGGVSRHVKLLLRPQVPRAAMGFIITEPKDTPPMSGSNSICVATLLLDAGLIPMTEPATQFSLEAPGGLVEICADCRNGKAKRITVTNLPSSAAMLGAQLEVASVGTLNVDTAYGGDSFVIVDAAALGFALVPDEALELAVVSMRITAAGTAQLGFTHPENRDWRHISFCAFAGAVEGDRGNPTTRSAVAIRPGKIDRSPTGTALSARMAVMHARGQMGVGDRLTATSLIGSQFMGQIHSETTVAGTPAILPQISGRERITGTHQHYLNPDDPSPEDFRLSDTWPAMPPSVEFHQTKRRHGKQRTHP